METFTVGDALVRPYDPGRDRAAVGRIWREIGWIGSDDHEERALDSFLAPTRAIVAELDGEAELCVTTADGTLRHGPSVLSMSAVTSVTASRIARRGGLASAMTARALATDAEAGLLTGALGIFDEGYYDRLGFGTGAAQRWWRLDPASIRVPPPDRRPVRLSVDDAEEIHRNRLAGALDHGACTIDDHRFTAAEAGWDASSFGLGFRDGDGRLTHHVWLDAGDNAEHGPYRVVWMAYESPAHLRELIGLLRSLADQVVQFDVPEPRGVQVQHLVDRPIRAMNIGSSGKPPGGRQLAWWQCRMLDVPGVVAASTFAGPEVRFVLELDDPIERHLPTPGGWRGVAGRYVVQLGATSSAEPGDDPSLPVLRCGVGTFTRLWLGVMPATHLPVTDDLDAPGSLLEQLASTITRHDPQAFFPF
ncbi:MAG: hypothetical protein AAFZ07_01060 [Actinomycetota bacterium]